MTDINLEILLGIIGVLILMAASINAFFLNKIYSELTYLKVGFSRLQTIQDSANELRTENKIRIGVLEKEVENVRFRIHSLEGATKNLASFLEEEKNGKLN